jgi:hypothetical protein
MPVVTCYTPIRGRVVGASNFAGTLPAWRSFVTDAARRHHYVPAFYLKQFAMPQDRFEGRLYVYDRESGRAWPSSPDNSAHQRDFYRVNIEGEHPNLAENTYEALETRFAPTLASVCERGTLPTDPTAMREFLAFVASQATRTPRVREMQQRFYGDVHMMTLRMLATDKPAFMKQLREMDGEISKISDEEADDLFAELGERVSTNSPAPIGFEQTRLIGDTLDLAVELEDMLARRHWILGRPNDDDARFITTDDPVHLQPATSQRMHPIGSPSFGDANTNVLVPLGPRLLLFGLSRPSDRARLRLSRRAVAEINGALAYTAHRFIFSLEQRFAFVDEGNTVVEGPTEALRLPKDRPQRSPFGFSAVASSQDETDDI